MDEWNYHGVFGFQNLRIPINELLLKAYAIAKAIEIAWEDYEIMITLETPADMRQGF